VRTELLDLIDRMCKKESDADSSHSVSWRAHREAEALAEIVIVPELSAFLSGKVTKEQRRAAYFIIGKIGKNSQCCECADVLIGFINKEKDKYALATLLDVLSDIKIANETDLNPVYRLIEDGRWLVRHAAIGSLKNAESPEAEVKVLAHLMSTEDPYDISCCNSTLNRIGTEQSIPQIKLGLSSKNRDVKSSAEQAILSIHQRELSKDLLDANKEPN